MGTRTYPWPPPMCEKPSPDWREPLWAKRLQHEVASLARKVTSPPAGVDWQDFLQEVRLTLLQRSWSEKSKWDPERGAWTTWACMVIKTFSQNYHKKHKLRIPVQAEAVEREELDAHSGAILPALSRSAPENLRVDLEPARPRRTVFPQVNVIL